MLLRRPRGAPGGGDAGIPVPHATSIPRLREGVTVERIAGRPSTTEVRSGAPNGYTCRMSDDGANPGQRRQWVERRRVDLAAGAGTGRWRRGLFAGSTPHHHDWHSRSWASRSLHRVGETVAHAASGVVAAALVLVWIVVGAAVGFPSWWATIFYVVTASVTFVMVFDGPHPQSRQDHRATRQARRGGPCHRRRRREPHRGRGTPDDEAGARRLEPERPRRGTHAFTTRHSPRDRPRCAPEPDRSTEGCSRRPHSTLNYPDAVARAPSGRIAPHGIGAQQFASTWIAVRTATHVISSCPSLKARAQPVDCFTTSQNSNVTDPAVRTRSGEIRWCGIGHQRVAVEGGWCACVSPPFRPSCRRFDG